MVGNVAEWTSTMVGRACDAAGSRPSSDDEVYVYEGCGWSCAEGIADPHLHGGAQVVFAADDLGFRCVYDG